MDNAILRVQTYMVGCKVPRCPACHSANPEGLENCPSCHSRAPAKEYFEADEVTYEERV